MSRLRKDWSMKEESGMIEAQVISCATVAEELKHIGVPGDRLTELEFGLHVEPEQLNRRLQEAIDGVEGERDILLGYGLCSYAVAGLKSERHRLVIPRVHDCIALFLGSRSEHQKRLDSEPGTYYLTKGWIEAPGAYYHEFLRLNERYGEERARRLIKVMLANYTTLALINTGNYRIQKYRDFTREMAALLELEYEEIEGSNRLLRMMLEGDWGPEFVVVEAGSELAADEFF